jgi:hypothetical protein
VDGVDVTDYGAGVQRLFARLVLLIAVLLLPFSMTAAPAAPHAMSSASMSTSRCPDAPSGHHGKPGIAECTMICSSALAAHESSIEEAPTVISAPPEPVLVRALHGILLETSTPPPKLT